MADRQVEVEAILGKGVHDADGQLVGHIEEISVRRQGKDWVIDNYKVGVIALLERFAGLTILDGFVKKMQPAEHLGYLIPWDKLDLTDPEHPRLMGRKQELKPIEPQEEQAHDQT